MEIFIAVVQDRHTDVDVEPFTDANRAIAWARKLARDSSDGDVDETLTESMKDDGWVYSGCYSCEGDSVHVVRKTLDAASSGR